MGNLCSICSFTYFTFCFKYFKDASIFSVVGSFFLILIYYFYLVTFFHQYLLIMLMHLRSSFYKKDFLWSLLILVPTLIGVFGIFRGANKQRGLIAVCTAVITVMSILAVCGKLVFITKYAIEILYCTSFIICTGYK